MHSTSSKKENLKIKYTQRVQQASLQIQDILSQLETLKFTHVTLPSIFLVMLCLACVVILCASPQTLLLFVGDIGAIIISYINISEGRICISSVQQNILASQERLMDFSRMRRIEQNDSEAVDLFKIVNQLLLDMKISRSSLTILLQEDNPAYLPSIYKEKAAKYILILPLGFYSLIDSHPERARAMLAHEFGHIIQQDTELWILAHGVSTALMNYSNTMLRPLISPQKTNYAYAFLASMNQLCLQDPMSMDRLGHGSAMYYGFCIALFLLSQSTGKWSLSRLQTKCTQVLGEVSAARLLSELNADLAAIAYADGASLAESLEIYVADTEGESSTHPPKQERIAMIRHYQEI